MASAFAALAIFADRTSDHQVPVFAPERLEPCWCCRSSQVCASSLPPEALHCWTVPELVYGMNSTILFGTDTFFAGYAIGK
jgi:hypothetical protein